MDAFDDVGSVIFNPNKISHGSAACPLKVLEQDRAAHHLKIVPGSLIELTAMGVALDLATKMDEISNPPLIRK